MWPWLAVLWERHLYDAHNTTDRSWWSRLRHHKTATDDALTIAPDTAVSIKNLGKDFKTSFWKGEKSLVTAVSDLSLEIPKFGIYVLLGSNGCVQRGDIQLPLLVY